MEIVDIFNYQNPWRKKSGFKVQPYFSRKIVDSILKWMDEPEVLVLLGPRQSGKTTILYKLIELQLNSGIPPEKIFFFNCDNLAVQSLLRDVSDLLAFLEQTNSTNNVFVYIDEVQRLTNPGLFLKQIYDLKLKIKLIVSGSSALEIKSQLKESLTGRKLIFPVLPFSFTEYLEKEDSVSPLLRTEPLKIIKEFPIFDKIWGSKLKSELYDFLLFGGYPRIITSSEKEKKKQLLAEIYSSYIQKDVSDFMKIENITGFNKLVQLLALISGQIINKNDLSLKSRLISRTVDKYLQILIDTFIVEKVTPFFSNKVKEIIKSPKIYFLDTGLRNAVITNFNSLNIRPDQGFLQETFIFNELKSIVPHASQIKFWRTKAGAEIDFVLDSGSHIIPFECKSLLRKPLPGRNFYSFFESYPVEKGYVLNANLFEKIKIGKTQITFIPYHWFPLLKNQLLK